MRGFRTDFRRMARTRVPHPTVLIVCEGGRTEPGYLKAWCRALGIHAQVRVHGRECGSHPKSVVAHAVKEASEAARDHTPYARTWCVFDRDEHVDIQAALHRATVRGIGVALSNPCFELWYLLHFPYYSTAYIDRAAAKAKVRQFVPGYTEAMCVHGCLPDEAKAIRDAQRLRRHHTDAGGTGSENPSTSVDLLIADLTTLATP